MTVFGVSGAAPRPPGFLPMFLKTLAFTLLFGIVGPMFLIVYVIIDEPAATEWMLYTGIGITVADVVLAVVIAYFRARLAGKIGRLESSGLLAQADIIELEQTGVQINDQPMMKLSLRIHGDGVATFDASKRAVVPLMSLSAVNARRLVVLVMPGTQVFVIDWERSAVISGTAPAVFTSAEDGRDYDLTGQAEPLMRILKILKDNGIRGDGLIDTRDDPVVRRQVMAVVREAARAAAPPAPPVADGRGVGERLAELENLRVAKSISETEYASMRIRILDSL